MPQLFDSLYKFANNALINAQVMNSRFQSLDARLSPLELLKLNFDTAQSTALAELQLQASSVVANLQTELASITSLNWLITSSATPLNVILGAQLRLLVAPSDATLFAPGPFSLLSRTGDPNFYAVVQTTGYDRPSGTYSFTVVSQNGTTGLYTDWQIAAVAGSTLAQLNMLTQVTALFNTVVADAAQVASNTAAVQANTNAVLSKFTVSSASPTGGNDGDIWFQV